MPFCRRARLPPNTMLYRDTPGGKNCLESKLWHAAEARCDLTLLGDGRALFTGLKAASAADFAGDERSLFRFCIVRSCIVQ